MEKPTKKEAYKNNNMNLIISLILSIVAIVVSFFIKSDWKYLVLVFGVFWFFYAFYEYFRNLGRISRTFCKRCSTWYDYENYDITWEEKRITINEKRDRATTTIEFKCHCSKCGLERTIIKDFTRATYNKDFNYTEERNPHKIAKNFFWND